MGFLAVLAGVLRGIPRYFGVWRLFIDMDSSSGTGQRIGELFGKVENCRLEPPGERYAPALLESKTAVIYGGYNSLMDVIFAQVPTLVVLREMQDEEQQIHLEKLKEAAGGILATVSETKITAGELAKLLLANLQSDRPAAAGLNTNGATFAAQYIRRLLG